MSVTSPSSFRERVLPMLEYVARQYAVRTPEGYPIVIDTHRDGTVGIEIDPNFALYLAATEEGIVADLTRRSSRNDARSSASQMKHGGRPFQDRRILGQEPTDQQLRNLIAELMMHFNEQPGMIHISDS